MPGVRRGSDRRLSEGKRSLEVSRTFRSWQSHTLISAGGVPKHQFVGSFPIRLSRRYGPCDNQQHWRTYAGEPPQPVGRPLRNGVPISARVPVAHDLAAKGEMGNQMPPYSGTDFKAWLGRMLRKEDQLICENSMSSFAALCKKAIDPPTRRRAGFALLVSADQHQRRGCRNLPRGARDVRQISPWGPSSVLRREGAKRDRRLELHCPEGPGSLCTEAAISAISGPELTGSVSKCSSAAATAMSYKIFPPQQSIHFLGPGSPFEATARAIFLLITTFPPHGAMTGQALPSRRSISIAKKVELFVTRRSACGWSRLSANRVPGNSPHLRARTMDAEGA